MNESVGGRVKVTSIEVYINVGQSYPQEKVKRNKISEAIKS